MSSVKWEFTPKLANRRFYIDRNAVTLFDYDDLEFFLNLTEQEIENMKIKYNIMPQTDDDEFHELFFKTEQEAQTYIDDFLNPMFMAKVLTDV